MICHHSAGLARPVVESVWDQDPVNQPGLSADFLPLGWKVEQTEQGQTRLTFPAKPDEVFRKGLFKNRIPTHVPRICLDNDRNTIINSRVFAVVDPEFLADGEGSQTIEALGDSQPRPEIVLTGADFAAPTEVAFSITNAEAETLGSNPVADAIDSLKSQSTVPSIKKEET